MGEFLAHCSGGGHGAWPEETCPPATGGQKWTVEVVVVGEVVVMEVELEVVVEAEVEEVVVVVEEEEEEKKAHGSFFLSFFFLPPSLFFFFFSPFKWLCFEWKRAGTKGKKMCCERGASLWPLGFFFLNLKKKSFFFQIAENAEERRVQKSEKDGDKG